MDMEIPWFPIGLALWQTKDFQAPAIDIDKVSLNVQFKECLREVIDKFPILFLRFPEFVLYSSPLHGLPDLVGQFCELCHRVATFLEIKVGPTIQCLYDDFFPSLSGEKNKRKVRMAEADLLEKSDPVHIWHIIV
nr:hypothetical protein [Methanofollis ethanolicus]